MHATKTQGWLRFSLISALLSLLSFGPMVHGEEDSKVILDGGDGIVITKWDIEAYIVESIPPQRRKQMLNKPNLYKDIAETLYVTRKLAREAAAQPDLDDKYATWAATMAYERRLSSQYRVQYIVDNLGDADWDALAREAYLVEKQRFKVPARVKASHILVKFDERGRDEALELAGEIREKVLAGEDFAALAEQYSEDRGSAKRGGDLGYFGRGKMVKPFEKAAFAMSKAGEISELVESQFGIHIIQLVDSKPEQTRSFEEVRDTLVDEIQTARGNELWQDKIIRLRSSPAIRWNEDALKQVAENTPKKLLGK